jgi:hypothetical protein
VRRDSRRSDQSGPRHRYRETSAVGGFGPSVSLKFVPQPRLDQSWPRRRPRPTSGGVVYREVTVEESMRPVEERDLL